MSFLGITHIVVCLVFSLPRFPLVPPEGALLNKLRILFRHSIDHRSVNISSDYILIAVNTVHVGGCL